jgi:hypothetical protein
MVATDLETLGFSAMQRILRIVILQTVRDLAERWSSEIQSSDGSVAKIAMEGSS